MLRLALRLNSSLRIDLQRAPAVRVTHEFLHYFHVLSVCHQHGRKAVAERVPADVLPNPGAEGCWADHTRKKEGCPASKGSCPDCADWQIPSPAAGGTRCPASNSTALQPELGPAAQVFETPRSCNCPQHSDRSNASHRFAIFQNQCLPT